MCSDVMRNIAHVFVTSGKDQDRPSKRDCFIATFMPDGIKQEGQEASSQRSETYPWSMTLNTAGSVKLSVANL